MTALKTYLLQNFELFFILLILVSVAIIVYFIPYKLTFLSFFFIPILLAASYLGTRQALLGAVFSVIMVSVYAGYFPEKFYVNNAQIDLMARIMVWAGFLILSGAVVGYLNQQLKDKMLEASDVNLALVDSKDLLTKTTSELMAFTKSFETKVAERTSNLEKSKQEIETHKHKVEDALYATMDAAVVKLMIENRLRTEKRRISILFCDLVSFTLYSEQRRAEVVITDLNRYLASMEDVLLLYNAHIDKYMGDGIMAEFGAPIDFERHSLMSVVAAIKMQQQLKSDNFPWQMRIGIATGEPIIGLIGHKRQSYTALGDVVNLASRIENLCMPDKVTIDLNTYQEIEEFVEVTSIYISSDEHHVSADLADQIEKTKQNWQQQNTAKLAHELATLYEQGGEYNHAKKYYKNAMELDPTNQDTKIKFAELSLLSEKRQDVPIKGRKKPTHLYQVVGIKNPLYNQEKIPKCLFDRYFDEVEQLVHYPEDLVLPVECLDGCVGHSKTVGFLAYALADALNLPDQEKKDILEAGQLADIGKSIIPHHLLNRRGSLNKEEFLEVCKHPREGVRKLKNMGYQNDAMLDIIQNHHEHYDGTGYPNNIAGKAIPLGSRIIAVAEAYSSLTSWRPYREKWESHAAMAELQKHANTGKFDPDLMDIFGHLLFEQMSSAELQRSVANVMEVNI